MGFFSSIFKPVTSVIGGILGSNSSKDAAAQQQSNWSAQHQLAVDQFNFQKEYTKNRLQWQVEDAKKAGLHPMVAAGLSPTSFSPVSSSPGNPVSPVDYSWVGNLGQTLDYASAKGKTTRQQAQALNFTLEAAQLQNEGLNLDNELKRMEIMSMLSRLTNSGPSAPAMDGGVGVIGGQDDAFIVTPSEVKSASSRGVQAGGPPSVRWFTNPDGSVSRSQSEQAKEANEDDVINTVGWHIDNNLVPLAGRFGYNSGVNPAVYAPPLSMLPKGAKGWLPDGYNKFVPVYKWNVRGAYYGDDR